jgi:hypothetical protein
MAGTFHLTAGALVGGEALTRGFPLTGNGSLAGKDEAAAMAEAGSKCR